jgi:4-hydroxybenzoate polyprenyltransferase
LACIRWRDTLVMQAPPVVGAILAGVTHDPAAMWRLPLLVVASLFLIAHIYAFNDWSGALLDQRDPNKAGETALCRGGSRTQLLVLFCVLGAGALLIYAWLSLQLLALGLAMMLFSAWYSWPQAAIQGKTIPVLSTVLHLGGSLLYFLSGYAIRDGLDLRGILIGGYFGVLIMAGHLAQEVQDTDGDRSNGLRTTATLFGPHFAFGISLVLFALSHVYLFALASRGMLPPPARWLVLLGLVHAGLAFSVWREGLGYAAVLRYRKRYQLLYGVVSIGLCLAALGMA